MLELDKVFRAVYVWLEGLFTRWGIPQVWLDLLSMLLILGVIKAE